MNSRERTFRALDFEQPDRVPVDFWMSKGFKRKLESALGVSEDEFLDSHDIDLRYIEGPRYIGPPLQQYSDGSSDDLWGVRRNTVVVPTDDGAESYEEVVQSPLASATTVEEINGYGHWPSADWFDYSDIEAQCLRILEQERVVVFMGDRLNRISQLKPAMYIRGIEAILADMGSNPDIAKSIFSNIRGFYRSYTERIVDAASGKLDILLTGDDFGAQNRPLVSPTMWLDFLGEGFAEYVSIAKGAGIRVMHHTCGAVQPLIPFMIERGLDILQSLQPEAEGMEPRELKAAFGDRLAFHGGISIQKTLPFGTAEDVRREVEDRIQTFSSGGGYIVCTSHNIQADTPLQNVLALLAAYKDYGQATGNQSKEY
jgi:uroporphyrinogen decarboxylase